MSTYAEVNLLPSASDWTFLVCWAHLTMMIMITFMQRYSVFEMTHCACVACDSKSDCSFLQCILIIDESGVCTVLFDCYMAGATWNCSHLGASCVHHNHAPCHITSCMHVRRVHACSAVTCHTYRPDVVIGCTQKRHDELHLLQIRTSRHQGFVTQQLAKDASCWPVAPNTVLT